MAVSRLISRYFCTANPTHRIFPYDQFDKLTEGPVTGKGGEAILLTSLNNGLQADELRWGWCWACGGWRQCSKRTQHELMRDYLSRDGISVRMETKSVEGKRLLAMFKSSARNGTRKR